MGEIWLFFNGGRAASVGRNPYKDSLFSETLTFCEKKILKPINAELEDKFGRFVDAESVVDALTDDPDHVLA